MDHQFRDTVHTTLDQYLKMMEGIGKLEEYVSKLDRQGYSDDSERDLSVQKDAASADTEVLVERVAPESLPLGSALIADLESKGAQPFLLELANPNAQSFMEQIRDNYEAQERMVKVAPREGKAQAQSKPEDAEAMINLFASKEVGQETYELKDGGEIILKEQDFKGYQHFEVTDPAGNIDMAFTICPNGQVLVDPIITEQLQTQIDAMTMARERGELDDNTPLMSRDKARVEAMDEFQKNISVDVVPVKTEKLEVKKDRNGNVSATSKSNSSAQMKMSKKATGGFRITQNSLSTEEIRDFNDAHREQSKLSASSTANDHNKPVVGQDNKNPKKKKSKSHAPAQ